MAEKTKGAAGKTISHSGILWKTDNRLVTMAKTHINVFNPKSTLDLLTITGYTEIRKSQICLFINPDKGRC
jgi:hypothetical protein